MLSRRIVISYLNDRIQPSVYNSQRLETDVCRAGCLFGVLGLNIRRKDRTVAPSITLFMQEISVSHANARLDH